jgi:hypothetical protein
LSTFGLHGATENVAVDFLLPFLCNTVNHRSFIRQRYNLATSATTAAALLNDAHQ